MEFRGGGFDGKGTRLGGHRGGGTETQNLGWGVSRPPSLGWAVEPGRRWPFGIDLGDCTPREDMGQDETVGGFVSPDRRIFLGRCLSSGQRSGVFCANPSEFVKDSGRE